MLGFLSNLSIKMKFLLIWAGGSICMLGGSVLAILLFWRSNVVAISSITAHQQVQAVVAMQSALAALRAEHVAILLRAEDAAWVESRGPALAKDENDLKRASTWFFGTSPGDPMTNLKTSTKAPPWRP